MLLSCRLTFILAAKLVPLFRLSNVSSLQLFQLIRYSTFILIGIGYAQLHLPQSTIGQFETFLLISGMVSFFWVSGLVNTMLAQYPKKDETGKKALLFNTFLALFAFSLIAGLLLVLFSKSLLGFLDKQSDGYLVQLSVLYLLLNNPSFIIEYTLFLNDRKKAIVIYGLVTSAASLLAAMVPALLQYPIDYSMYGLIAVAFIRLVYALNVLNRFAGFGFDFNLQVDNLKLSAPLILSLFVSGSSEYIDGLIVKAKFNDMFFALFRYGAKELPILLIMANTFSAAMITPIAANLQNGLKEMKDRSAKLMHIFFPVSLALMLFSPVIYRYVFGENFVYSSIIFNVYLLLAIPRVLFPQTILTGMQQTRYLLVSSLLEIVINVSLSVYLAGKIGLPGIAAGTFIAYTFDKLFLMTVAYWVYGIKPSAYIRLAPFFIYSVALLVAFGVSQYLFKIQFWGF